MRISDQHLRDEIHRLNEIIQSGLPYKEKTMLSFFRNMTDNISVWACRGRKDNFEIVFWNKGAEKIYGYPSEYAIGKNCTTLFMCDAEREKARDDIEKIIAGEPYYNMIAHDINGKGDETLILTNTFRIEDYEREGEFLQAEIGVDISEKGDQLTPFRSLEEVNRQFALLEDTLNAFGSIDESDNLSVCEKLEKIVKYLSDTLGEKTKIVACINSIAPEAIKNFTFSNNNEITESIEEIGSLLDRRGRADFFINNRYLAIPLFLPKSKVRVGLVYIEFSNDYPLYKNEKDILGKIAKRISVSFKYAIYNAGIN